MSSAHEMRVDPYNSDSSATWDIMQNILGHLELKFIMWDVGIATIACRSMKTVGEEDIVRRYTRPLKCPKHTSWLPKVAL